MSDPSRLKRRTELQALFSDEQAGLAEHPLAQLEDRVLTRIAASTAVAAGSLIAGGKAAHAAQVAAGTQLGAGAKGLAATTAVKATAAVKVAATVKVAAAIGVATVIGSGVYTLLPERDEPDSPGSVVVAPVAALLLSSDAGETRDTGSALDQSTPTVVAVPDAGVVVLPARPARRARVPVPTTSVPVDAGQDAASLDASKPVTSPDATPADKRDPTRSPDANAVSTLQHELRLYDQGISAMRSARYRQARELFDRYLVQYPRGYLYQEVAESLARTCFLAKNDACVLALIARQPADPRIADSAEIWRTLGEVYQDQGRCAEARSAWERSLRLKSSAVTRQLLLRLELTCMSERPTQPDATGVKR